METIFKANHARLVAALAILFFIASPLHAQYRIAGTIVDANSGSPLPRARVEIADVKSPQVAQSIVTEDDGHFEFNGLAAGKYALQGNKRGYMPTAYDQHDQFSTAIVTGVGVDTEHLMFRLPPAAAIIGKVLDEGGEPVRDANVTLYRETHATGMTRITRFRGSSTDDLGFYEFTSLSAGNYFLSVQANPWYAIHPPSSSDGANQSAPVDRTLDVAYPVTYYAGATESDDATPILLRNGDHAEIDFHLAPVPALRVRLASPKGQDWTFLLEKRSFDTTERQLFPFRQRIPGGVLEIAGVPAGNYLIRASGESRPAELGNVDITRDGQQLNTSTSESLGSAHLTVEVIGESKIPSQLALGLQDRQHRAIAFQLVGADGQVSFEGLTPGRYSLLAPSAGKLYSVARVTVGGASLVGSTITVSPGEHIEATVSITTGSATVEGFAQLDGKPIAGAMIVLVPKDPESNYQLFRRDQSDLDGTFSLRDVLPGAYTAIAILNGWDLDWSSPGAIARYATRGQAVVVGAGARGPVKLAAPLQAQSR